MIKPDLSDLINKHKTHGSARYHSGNKSWIEKTSSEWKIQLTMAINFISSKDSDSAYDSVDVLYYNLNKVSLSRGGSYIDSPKWLKNKATINPNKKDDKCFQYALIVALNHEQIKNNPERISKIKPFIDQYNWNEIFSIAW